MPDHVDMRDSRIGTNCVVDRPSDWYAMENYRGETFREQAKVLRTRNGDIIRRVHLFDGVELCAREVARYARYYGLRRRRGRSVGCVSPNESRLTAESCFKVVYGNGIAESVLSNAYSQFQCAWYSFMSRTLLGLERKV